MRGPGPVSRVSMADAAQGIFFLPIADSGSFCTYFAAFDPAGTGNLSGYAVLRDRGRTSLSKHPKRYPFLRLAVDRGDGSDAGSNPDRVTAFSLEAGVWVSSWCICTIGRIFYWSGGGAVNCHL